jgi:flagellar basal body-associated protein FliL
MTEDAKTILLAVVMVLACGIIGAGSWVFRSHMEASAFNAVTGKNVTTWQAMWIELRVQENGKGDQ